MYDMHKELNQFYQNHVRLGKERETLAQHRDTNLERLKAGLEELSYPNYDEHRDQGSYAMFTINQQPNKDYDIDEAVIFNEADLPTNALETRKRVEAAMIQGGGNFSQPPEAKTNAVRVYYAEGHHIDLAIYRKYEDDYGKVIYEHAGSDWSLRHPMEITNWFNDTVRQCSPKKDFGATVDENQMRRIVRWLKVFSKSRESWDLPGGLIISVLVSECYVSHNSRDDVSLYDTAIAVYNRLVLNLEVRNPVDNSQTLTDQPIDLGRVKRFREKLERANSELAILHDNKCTEEQAKKAWFWFFQHPFWSTTESSESVTEMGKRLGDAAQKGELYITPTGQVLTEKPVGAAIKAPPQKFFGKE